MIKICGLILSLLFFFCAPVKADPWWQQSFKTSETVTETTLTYGSEGDVLEKEETYEGGILTFEDLKPWRLESLSDKEKAYFGKIKEIKESKSKIEDAVLLQRLLDWDPSKDEGMAVNMMGFYEYETETGYFSYLRKKPNSKTVKIYDAWFEYHEAQFPSPPKTLKELQETEITIHEQVGRQFRITRAQVEDIVYKMQKYQEKHGLPKNIPLRNSL